METTTENTGSAAGAGSSPSPGSASLEARIDEVLALVRESLLKAYAKHRGYPNGHYMWAVIREELDELWEHVKADTWSSDGARKEALQIAAMGVRYVLDVAPLRVPCAACDRGDFQLGHSDGCPQNNELSHGSKG